jgi:ribosomal protein S18 acetylase RimI-like enzyme
VGIVIRPWQKGDWEVLRKLTWKSWVSTYASFIPESDLKSYFDIQYTGASFLKMFDDPFMKGIIAEVDDQIAGYSRLFFNQDENRLYVPSLYLLPDFQGVDIGRRLLEAAEGYAMEKGLDEIWIGVMVKNRQGLIFYRKVGFQFVREEPFTMGKTTVSHLIGYKKLRRTAPLNQKIQTAFDRGENLSELCIALLSEQRNTWLDLQEGYESFQNIRSRDVLCRGFSVCLQYNPGRIKNSLAVVDEKNANERPCFLCLNHLPEGQKGILYQSDYLILCNPRPVFSSHLTVSHLDHRFQAIGEHIDTFLHLMADFGSGWTVLYNGPKCGASAPDHLHFQVAPSGKMPIEKEIREEKRLILMKKFDHVLLYCLRDLGREVILLKGNEPMALERVFKVFLNALKKALLIDEEPMINIAGFYKEGGWLLVIFPRQKHRPDAFFREGDARVVVSPGVIDMGGLLITPIEKDFEKLNAASIESLFAEVSLDGEAVKRAIDGI